jgi:hypothetical protein
LNGICILMTITGLMSQKEWMISSYSSKLASVLKIDAKYHHQRVHFEELGGNVLYAKYLDMNEWESIVKILQA